MLSPFLASPWSRISKPQFLTLFQLFSCMVLLVFCRWKEIFVVGHLPLCRTTRVICGGCLCNSAFKAEQYQKWYNCTYFLICVCNSGQKCQKSLYFAVPCSFVNNTIFVPLPQTNLNNHSVVGKVSVKVGWSSRRPFDTKTTTSPALIHPIIPRCSVGRVLVQMQISRNYISLFVVYFSLT